MNGQKAFFIFLSGALSTTPVPAQTATNDAQQRALEVLHQTIADQSRKADAAGKHGKAPATTKEPTFANIEQQYLDGKITAKQFQKYLEQHKLEPARPAAANKTDTASHLSTPPPTAAKVNPAPAPAVAVPPPAAVAKTAVPPPKTVVVTPQTAPPPSPAPVKVDKPATVAAPATALPVAIADKPPVAPEKSKLADVEAKMDELVRLKAARDNAAASAATNAASSQPAQAKTKRQRLDDLLKLYIDGKVSDTEYRERRNKIIAGPE